MAKTYLRENRLSRSTHRKVALIVARWRKEDKARKSLPSAARLPLPR